MNTKKRTEKNKLIKEILSTIIFGYILYASDNIPNINSYFHIFIAIGFIFFLISTIHTIKKELPKIKSMFHNRKKLYLTKNFKLEYTIYLMGITVSAVSLWLSILVSIEYIIFQLIGIGWIIISWKNIMRYRQKDLKKIDCYVKRRVKKLIYKISS